MMIELEITTSFWLSIVIDMVSSNSGMFIKSLNQLRYPVVRTRLLPGSKVGLIAIFFFAAR